MDEDQILQSIIADPKLTDPSIDVGQLRQTTPTRTELLADVPEFSGLKFDPTQRSYIEDLYTLYGGGAPMLPEPVVDTPVVDTPVIDTPVIDTPVDNVIGPTLPGFDSDSPKNTDFEQNLIDQGIGVQGAVGDPVVAPGEMPLTQNDFDAFNEIAVTPQSGITGDPIDVGIPDNESGFVDPLGTISGAPVVGDFSEPTTGTISDDRLNEVIGGQPMAAGPFDYLQEQTPISQVTVGTGLSQTEKDRLADYTPSFETPKQQEGFLQNVLGIAGQTVEGALNELSKVPGAVVDFANQTVDIFGKRLNVGKTLAAAAVNRVVGAPISLVFDLVGALGLEGGRGEFANELAKEYGMDDIGRLTSGPMAGYAPNSMFGDIVEAAQERIDNIENRAAPQTEASIKKVQELNEFIQKATAIKAKQTAPQEDIGTVPGGEGALDETSSAEDIAQDFASKQAEAELRGENIVDEFSPSDIQATDPSLDIPDRQRGDGQDNTPSGPPEGPGTTADDAFEDTGRSDTGSVSTAGQAGPPSQRGGEADMGSAAANEAAAAQDAARGGQYGGPPSESGGNGGNGGGGKIVCTMMNESYGFGSFRNKIWLRHSKDLAPEYQIGYHKIFLPLVKLSKTNKILKKTLEHIAVHRTIDIRQESRGKVHVLGRIYRKILEPICYWVGKYAKR